MSDAMVGATAKAQDSAILDLGDEDTANQGTPEDNSENTSEMSPETNSSAGAEKNLKVNSQLKPELNSAQEPESKITDEATIEDENDKLNVEFFKPEYGERQKDGRIPLVISGTALPHTLINIRSSAVPRFKPAGGVEAFRLRKKNVGALPARANDEGLFFFHLFLPEGQYQIPIVMSDPAKPENKKVYQISFKIDKKSVKLPGNENDRGMLASPFLKRNNHFSLGIGTNYLTYSKSNIDPNASMEVNFQSVKGPAFFLEYWRKFNQQFEFAFNYKSSPGETTSSSGSGIAVSQGQYNWITVAADGIYYPKIFQFAKKKKYHLRSGFRFGFQYHLVPFLRTTTSTTDFEIISNPITMAALGYQVEYEPSPDWRYEVFMRYQRPLSSGSAFAIKPLFAIDGSMGVQYNFGGYRWSVGGFWYGQWHQYKSDEFDRGYAVKTESTQKLFFSNLEARLIYHF